MRRPDAGSELGYTLVGLMVVVAVINVSLAVAVTSTRTLARRAREAELIWRGQQIARAVGCYEQANAGEPLTRLEQLVEADCLRRVYRDPMVRDGQWRILRQQDVADGTVAALLGVEVDTESAGVGGASGGGLANQGSTAGRTSSAVGAAPSLGTTGATFGRQRPTAGSGVGISRLPGQPTRGPTGAGAGENAIVGVVSRSVEASLRIYGEKTKHSQWVFLGGQAAAAGSAAPGVGGQAAAQGLTPQR
ncbi:MAG TPA: hypothetical protein QGG47_03830 [Acidobacteriota bacterium]|nr:hypothetical protein [Acidobacteriota bacterium]